MTYQALHNLSLPLLHFFSFISCVFFNHSGLLTALETYQVYCSLRSFVLTVSATRTIQGMCSNTTKQLTPLWHYLPGDSIRFNKLWAQSYKIALLPYFRCQSQVQVLTCASDQLGYTLEGPTAASSGLINLLKWLTVLRKTVYLLDYHFFK